MAQQNEGEREIEECIQLFCHPHLLELTCSNNQTHNTVTPPPCTNCSLQRPGWMHNSGLFNFTLHMPCTRLPSIINHPAHPNHLLALVPTTAYPALQFTCDGCCLRVNGFCYYCNHCNFGLHVLCASLPPVIDHPYHPSHSLHRTAADCKSYWFSCDGCGFTGCGSRYRCHHCDFDLHVLCASLPPQINHPSHPNHLLFLTRASTRPIGQFFCDGCRNRCHGFWYRCHHCNFDLHVRCVSLPLSLSHQSHPHLLQLIFGPPYKKKKFFCDICRQKMGFNHWLYHCAACKFDAHLDCATNGKHLNQSHRDNGGIGNAIASGIVKGLVKGVVEAVFSGNNN